jgi:hypothetical protein
MNHLERVRDQDQRQAEAPLKICEKVENLCLYGGVQSGNRLIGNQEPGFQGQRSCDSDPLLLAAAQACGASAEQDTVQGNSVREILNPLFSLPACAQVVYFVRLEENLPDGQVWIEGGEGILKNDLELATFLAQSLGRKEVQIRAIKADGSGGGFRQAQNAARECGLPAA